MGEAKKETLVIKPSRRRLFDVMFNIQMRVRNEELKKQAELDRETSVQQKPAS